MTDRLPPARVLRHLVVTSRPLSWINTAYPFGAAWLLAGGGLDATFWVGCFFFLVPYNLAMYGINDVFDFESDLRNPRKGGLEGDVLDRRVHRTVLWAAALTCVPFVVWLLVAGGPQAITAVIPVLGLSLFAVVAYSVRGLRFKEIPLLDSLTSSTHFSSPAWVALAVLSTWPSPAGWCGLAAFFLWGVASQAFGAVQDVGPDREAGLGSIATVLGARATVWVSLAGYVAAGVLALGAGPVLQWAALGAVPYIVSVARFVTVTDQTSADAHRGWTTFLWLNYLVGFGVTMLLLVHAGALPVPGVPSAAGLLSAAGLTLAT
ncbi:MAG: prenyltransferase [Brevibacterium yomogidense]|uniref:Lycopene elongase n=1 Tax=Brevibacterium yomogidense TaxID=946573 RepID=A0A1X6WTS8_9MICO|nr:MULTISPECIES: prenyltransferase [Brevibacterium]SLM88454.1 Lycopene elongase [Brevibacterium yomogidense]SMX65899.1 4-hydroxybenzoate polyprenyltransferase [Brevibacterium sp. Mu109]